MLLIGACFDCIIGKLATLVSHYHHLGWAYRTPLVRAAATNILMLVVTCPAGYFGNACADASSGPAVVRDVMAACGMQEDEWVPSA
jgi:hypothetical protein